MPAARVIWIVWCLFWVAAWLILGWLVLPFINLLFAVGSGAAIFIPIGKPPRSVKPPQQYQPLPPSSVYDPRFSDEERRNHFR